MTIKEQALELHRQWRGKLEIALRAPVATQDDLKMAYTPGVAEPCLAIQQDPEAAYVYTRKGNLVAIVTDGSAVLGLGNIGALGGMPVMEGKAALFKAFGGVDAFPILLDTQDTDEIVQTIARIAPTFGGINLEDISAPRCFEIERRLKERLDIPVFHDDQHGTAIVALAALTNALKLVQKRLEDVRIVLVGPGAAGVACAKLLLACGARHMLVCNRKGILRPNDDSLDTVRRELAALTNPENRAGTLSDALVGADVFIGLSAPGVVTPEDVKRMNADAILFAMANPTPEIDPALAKAAGARVVGTGRSDYPNQINNVLAFPGVFRGALDVRARDIDESMKLAAARAIAALVSDGELSDTYILPAAFDKRVGPAVASAVAQAARDAGLAR